MSSVSTYTTLGIDPKAASRWQAIAAIPEPVFQQYIDDVKETGKELTTAGAYRLAREVRQAEAGPWTESEEERRDWVKLSGLTVLANQRCDHHLIGWAKENGIFIPIDRHSYPLGNPMKMDADHDRATRNHATAK
jgi:hypothetical protein